MRARVTLWIMAILGLSATAVIAHPMGNFSISHYTALRAERDGLHIRYRLDMAEIPTFQEMSLLDTSGDGDISLHERRAYLQWKVEELTRGQRLLIDGRAAVLLVVGSDLLVQPGAGNLPTLLITVDYLVPLPAGDGQPRRIIYSDENYAERVGWREIIATAGHGLYLTDSTVPARDRSQQLTSYPADPTIAPPQQSRAAFTVAIPRANVAWNSTAPQASVSVSPLSDRQPRGDRFTRLITTNEVSTKILFFSLLVALMLGVVHAMSPGHGKTVVAAYLVGSRGTIKHAFLLGAVVTLTHTAGVFALGLVALFASRYILPEQLYPWLGFVSGMMIVGIGLWQFVKRYAQLHSHSHTHPHVHHDHSHQDPTHRVSHHQDEHQQHRGHHQHHHGAHDHAHHVGHHQDERQHRRGHHDYHHGAHGHSHQIDKITPASLVAMGISGGLVPCPSALVVLLSAISLNRIGFGMLLIVAFSLGLASVLIGIGVLVLYVKQALNRFRWQGGLVRRLPLCSSAMITMLGLVIVYQALVGGGIVQVNLLDLAAGVSLLMTIQSGFMSALSSDPVVWTALGLGFVLGLKHALDPDHLIAVSTIVSEHKSLKRSSLIGAFWGVGHTTSLLLVGLLVIGLRLTIPDRVALSMEFCVAMMLIALGANLIWKTWRVSIHSHPHTHADGQHHAHTHVHVPGAHHHEEPHVLDHAKRPLLIGMVHGLAGSAALMLLVLTTIPSPWLGLAYIVVFGLGSIGGMLLMSSMIGMPFVLTAERFSRFNQGIKMTAGMCSVIFGLFLAWQIGFVEGLFR
ncbi:MAG: hypothetical protein NZ823_09380 [Blastocatellia bacterium]|nr:hypothetical protein [Blastocatellia bacterium]